MSDVIIVLGMHRSGTSAVAGTLTRLGGDPPRRLMPADAGNARGYFKSLALMEFHDELLASAGTDWRDWRAFNPDWARSPVAERFKERAKDLFDQEFDGAALPVVKDPRLCRFAPFWLDLLQETGKSPRIVMPVRSPLEVAQSLSKRNGFPLAKGMLLWLRHNLDAELHTRNRARSIFLWNDFLSDWRRICEKIAAETGLSWSSLSDRTAREIDLFLSKELIHHQSDHATLAAHSQVHEWTLRAYEALLELANHPFSNSALDTLDQIRSRLDTSSRMFGRLLTDYEAGLEDLHERERGLTHKCDGLQEQQTKQAADLQAQRQALADQAAALAALDQSRLAAEANHAACAQEADALRAEGDLLRTKLAELEEESARVRAETERAAQDPEQEAARLQSLLSQEQERAAAQAQKLLSLEARHNLAIGGLVARAEKAEQKLTESARAASAHSNMLENARAELAEAQRALIELTGKYTEALKAGEAAHEERLAMAAQAEKAWGDLDRVNAARIQTEREAQDARRELVAAQRGESDLQAQLTLRQSEQEQATRELHALKNARTELTARLEKMQTEKGGLEGKVIGLESDLQQMIRTSAERAAAQEAAQSHALAEAQKTHDAQTRALRTQLVDAEAALSHINRRRGRAAKASLSPSLRRRLLARKLVRSGLFDPAWYAKTYPDTGKAGLAAAEHYLEIGFCKGYQPNPFFDTRWYLERYEDVRRDGVNPLMHYLMNGWREGRDPGPEFETAFYLESNPDVRANGMNPLVHYLRHGRYESRIPTAHG